MAEVRDAVSRQISELTPHPRNYNGHPQPQVDALALSMEESGFYKNIVISSDDFILAGHGAVEAAAQIGLEALPAVQMPFTHDDPRAIKIVVADNSLALFSEQDDQLMAELLREIHDAGDLAVTGYDEMMLDALEQVIRPPDQLMGQDFDPLEEWEAAGMPDFEVQEDSYRLVLHFDDPEERDHVASKLGIYVTNKEGRVWSAPYPPVEGRADRSNIMIEG